jgi:cell division protein FtsB
MGRPMLSFLKVLITNKYALGAAGLLLALAAIWGYGHHEYAQGVTDTQTAAQIAAYAQYKETVERIEASNSKLQDKLDKLNDAQPRIITQYRDRVIKVPLPADCRIDPDRLRGVQSAIDSANAAR